MDRTYVFNSDGNSGGGYPAVMPFMPGGFGNGFGAYGQDGLWGLIYLAVFASIFGWNGNGIGFGGHGGGIPAQLSGDAGRELLMQAIQGNRSATDQIASALNCSSQQVLTALGNIQNTLGLSGQQIINAVQSGNSGIIPAQHLLLQHPPVNRAHVRCSAAPELPERECPDEYDERQCA